MELGYICEPAQGWNKGDSRAFVGASSQCATPFPTVVYTV